MRSSQAHRFSPARLPPGVARALLLAAWVAGWVGLCAWVVWFAHSQAANPRQEAMRAWCRTRVRYLQQDIRSSISRAQEAIGVVRTLGHFGPRSSSNLSYWGLAGCVNYNSMMDYNLQADKIGNFSTGTILMIVTRQDRPLVESIIGHTIQSVLGLPAPKKDLYGVNVFGSINPEFPVQPFTDFFPLVPPVLRTNLLRGQTVAGAPLSTGPGYVAIVFIVPIFRHPLPAGASVEQIRRSISSAWAGVVHLEMMARQLLHMLENGSSTHSFAMYDNTETGVLRQIYGPEEPRLESGSAFPFVLPPPVVVPPEHVEPFPEDMMGRTFEAHCGFEGPYPKWDLVYAPMLLGLLVLLVAVLLSTVIAVLVRKKRSLEADVKEIQLCTVILERAERSKSEAVASTSHELRTPIIGMMGMIEELLDSPLEEWQQEDLRVARACAGETVELINRVLDLAKLQAGRLQLETLPCCLRRIVQEATATVEPGKNLQGPVMTSVVHFLFMKEGVQDKGAMNNTAAGHIAIRLWCIPPPHAASSPPASAAASTGATQASSEPPPESSGYPQLAGCVQRFPPPTRLLCLPQRQLASQGGPVGNGGGQVCSRDDMGSAEERQGGDGRLEEEVREWVEGACAVRADGEWMVVVACEDTGGGIPPEQLWGLLDPHGLACHSPHDMHGNGQHKVMERIRSLGRADSRKGLGRLASLRQRDRSVWDPLQRDRKAAAGPRWTPYPVRFLLSTSLVSFLLSTSLVSFLLSTSLVSFLLSTSLVSFLLSTSLVSFLLSTSLVSFLLSTSLVSFLLSTSLVSFLLSTSLVSFLLSTSLVAEMRGGMAVLSDASTGTTILLALPLGGGEDAGSREGKEGKGEVGKSGGAVGARVGRESGPRVGTEGPASAVTAQPAAPQKLQARALAHAHTFPQAGVERAGPGVEGVGGAEGVVRGVVAGRRVAVVDDNAVNRMVARRTLQGYGAHVLLLCSGEEALQALSSATPSPPIHLLLLDLHMPPGIDGSVPCPTLSTSPLLLLDLSLTSPLILLNLSI
ncbi:unnamed protein product [Closterium sp. Naga37s-1]|nr:unnamed protein product [Closterium sp. Naga37s-1]